MMAIFIRLRYRNPNQNQSSSSESHPASLLVGSATSASFESHPALLAGMTQLPQIRVRAACEPKGAIQPPLLA